VCFCWGLQNNEAEALRSWRSALETIYYHNAYRVPPNYAPKSETERALQESIRQLELQCKERVDLIEALQESRKEAQDKDEDKDANPKAKLEKGKKPVNGTASHTPGWIGDGTIPAVDYMDLSKPPTLPARPQATPRSPVPAQIQRTNSGEVASSYPIPPASASPTSAVPMLDVPLTQTSSRGSSPERRKVMLTTLRQKKDPKKTKTKAPGGRNGTRPAASKAAGLAWGTTTGKGPSGDSSTVPAQQRMSSESEVKREAETKIESSEEAPKANRRRLAPSDYIPTSSWREPQSPDESQSKPPLVHYPQSPDPTGTAAAAAASRSLAVDPNVRSPPSRTLKSLPPPKYPSYRKEYPSNPLPGDRIASGPQLTRSPSATQAQSSSDNIDRVPRKSIPKSTSTPRALSSTPTNRESTSSPSGDERVRTRKSDALPTRGPAAGRKVRTGPAKHKVTPPSTDPDSAEESSLENGSDRGLRDIMKKLPKGVDVNSARQILNDIVVRGDEVHWEDVAGLDTAKKALKEAVVYPFLRPDLFMGLREPARGMLLFGPPGTGKTMLARAVATESKSTFFSISASSLTSKWHGESEKLVRALFGLAKVLAPSIIFVDEIDSLLSTRSSGSEHEASRRSKTEFLIQWSDLQRAAAGREQTDSSKEGDPSRVLVLAATNLPWDIDEAARRRFVRRQYIPLPEDHVREQQLRRLLSHQKQELSDEDIEVLVKVTEGECLVSFFFFFFFFFSFSCYEFGDTE
jgi:SpoVK/Ycf46/Vps4 family AAA+-type ATPase